MPIVNKWFEKDGIIYFWVVSDGANGKEEMESLARDGFAADAFAASVLLSEDFKPTKGRLIEIAIFRGSFFSDDNRTIENIKAEACRRNFIKPNAEVAYLIRKKFTDQEFKDMGLRGIMVMHEPSNNHPDIDEGYSNLTLCFYPGGCYDNHFLACGIVEHTGKIPAIFDFVFEVSQTL